MRRRLVRRRRFAGSESASSAFPSLVAARAPRWLRPRPEKQLLLQPISLESGSMRYFDPTPPRNKDPLPSKGGCGLLAMTSGWLPVVGSGRRIEPRVPLTLARQGTKFPEIFRWFNISAGRGHAMSQASELLRMTSLATYRFRWQDILCLFNILPVLTIWYIHLYIVCVHMIVLYQYTTSESYAVHSSKGAAPRFKRPPAPRPSRGCMDCPRTLLAS